MKMAICLMVLFGIVAAGFGKMRIWTASTGQTIEAEYVKDRMGKVYFKTPAGKEKCVPILALSKEDQDFINLKHLPKLEIKVDENRKKGQRQGDIDNVKEDLQFSVEIIKTSKRHYPGTMTAYLFVCGKDLNKDEFVLLEKKEESFALPPDSTNKYFFKGRPLALEHDPDPGWGIKYEDYLVCIMTSDGTVLATKGSTQMKKHLPVLSKASQNAHFDRNMKPQR